MSDNIDNGLSEEILTSIPKVYTLLVSGTRTPYTEKDALAIFGGDAPSLLFEASQFEALRNVDAAHATFMRNLTGNATIEERDTWQSKELAARAFEDETATPAQIEMLTIEATYIGTTPDVLATTVITKADQFKKLTGLAAGVRGKARAAIKAATTPQTLEDAAAQAQADVEGALAALQNG